MGQKKSKFSVPMGGRKVQQGIPQNGEEPKVETGMNSFEEKPHDISQGDRYVKNEPVARLPNIPQDSPLGIMIKYWNDYPSKEGKSREKMVYYYMEVWGGRNISQNHVYWPIYGAFKDWICQALSVYVNCKEPFNAEESEYASLWMRSDTRDHLFLLKGRKGQENMCNLPPPYISPTPMPSWSSPGYNSVQDGHWDVLIPNTLTKTTTLYLDEAQEYVKSFAPAQTLEPATPSHVSAQARNSMSPPLVSAQTLELATPSHVSAQARDSSIPSPASVQILQSGQLRKDEPMHPGSRDPLALLSGRWLPHLETSD